MEIDGLDGLIQKLHDTIKAEAHNLPKYSKIIKRLLGVPFKTARKTYDSYALLNNIDFQIRIHLLGQRDASIKRHYTNFEMRDIRLKVRDANTKILTDFCFFDYASYLLDSDQVCCF